MIRKLLGLSMFFWALYSQSYGQQPSHEEAIVREAYAKVAYMTEVNIVGKAALDSYTAKAFDQSHFTADLTKASPEFTLDSFEVGDFSQIANKKLGELISVPTPPAKVLKFDTGNQGFRENDQVDISWHWAKAHWESAEDLGADSVRTLSDLTLQQAIVLNKEGPFERYATFCVTISFQGHSEGPVRAFFLFGKDAKGTETATPQDNFSDSTALAIAVSEPMDPNVFLKTHLRETPVLSNWLASHEMFDQACVADKLCCSGSRCGIRHADLQKGLLTPVNGERWRGAKGVPDAN